ncbi:MAG: substrate-binding domain-containing protein [Woeseiaceae bacterium]|nr:substrate-binding domain-containing protein [Woeseiaceae bacterium]
MSAPGARWYLAGLAACLAACGGGNDDAPGGADVAMPAEPIVVYLDEPGEVVLRPVFDAFTEETGLRVTVREADAAKNLADVIDNSGAPPADVLITDNIQAIWRAGDEGGLRRLDGQTVPESLPPACRDPDLQWFALGLSSLSVVRATRSNLRAADYADLADERFAGKLCLTSSARAENRALIAHLVDELGVRPAERLVRRWLANLARPPMYSPTEVLEAMAAGVCNVSILPLSSLGDAVAESAIEVSRDAADVRIAYGAGLARHARYPESAIALMRWLASPEGQREFAAATGTVSAYDDSAEGSPEPLSLSGWRDEDARLLAERAGWR